MNIFLFIISFYLFIANSYATDYVWIIGGGPTLDNSQAQIELNTKWIQKLLKKHKPNAIIKVYFTDGNSPSVDIKFQDKYHNVGNYEAIMRIYDGDSHLYYNNTVEHIHGSTQAKFLRDDLLADFKKLKKNDSVLLIFQGHGDLDKYNTANNSFKLWEDSRFSVVQLDEILNQLEKSIPVRFIFPQCYSGGFSRLIYQNSDYTAPVGDTLRCGFLAEYDFEESEGCTTSINESDYRDYSTYFFAALDGKSREGKLLTADPDRDKDGKITLREAHFYSISQAISTDIPRSTSETYLEKWAPWYLRWTIGNNIPNNIYSSLAQEVARNNGLTLKANAQVENIETYLNEFDLKAHSLLEEQEYSFNYIPELQKELKTMLADKWPDIRFPYTQKNADLLKNHLLEINDFVLQQVAYKELRKLQINLTEIDKQLLEIKRKISQFQKINKLNHLAILLEHFNHLAKDEELKTYQRIVDCESQSF